MINPHATLRPSAGVVYHDLGSGGLLLDLATDASYSLNSLGSLIWKLLGEGVTFAAVLRAVRSRVDAVPTEIAADVKCFLEGLSERNLIRIAPMA